jgi:pectate lyase
MATLTVGPGQQYSTLAAAVTGAKAGDTIQVMAGTYVNDFPGYISNLTIVGVGGQANFVATVPPPNSKAIIAESGNTTLQNLTFSGAAISSTLGGNAAGIRYEGGNLTVENCSFHDNQKGFWLRRT